MVQGWINVVDSNCVDTELLHEGSVTEAAGAIAQRVSLRCSTERVGTAGLVAGKSISGGFDGKLLYRSKRFGLCNVRNTNDLKTIARDIVYKVGTLDLHILYS